MLAELLKEKRVIRQIKEILEEIFSENEVLQGSEILKHIRPIVKEDIEDRSLLYHLQNKAVIKKEKISDDICEYSFSLNKQQLDEYISSELKSLKIKSEIKDKEIRTGKFQIVATFPEDERYHHIEKINDLLLSIRTEINKSTKEILICNPFFDTIGQDAIIEDLINAARRGCLIKIITREFHSRENDDHKQGIIKLIREFKQHNLLNNLFFRDYHIVDDETGKQISSLHAKLIIFDCKKAYLGSANLTYPSLYYNFELGVIIEEDLKELTDTFYRLWDISRKIDVEKEM